MYTVHNEIQHVLFTNQTQQKSLTHHYELQKSSHSDKADQL